MLRLVSDPNDTYAPYAMTNKQLTDAVSVKSADATINGITYNARIQGKMVVITTSTGSLTEAVSSYAELVRLSDFGIFSNSDVFVDSYFALITDGTTVKGRAYTSNNDARIITNNGITAGSAFRFTLVGFIK